MRPSCVNSQLGRLCATLEGFSVDESGRIGLHFGAESDLLWLVHILEYLVGLVIYLAALPGLVPVSLLQI